MKRADNNRDRQKARGWSAQRRQVMSCESEGEWGRAKVICTGAQREAGVGRAGAHNEKQKEEEGEEQEEG